MNSGDNKTIEVNQNPNLQTIMIRMLKFKHSRASNSFSLATTSLLRMGLLALVTTIPGIIRADIIDYAVTLDNELGTIDLQTGTFTQLGKVVGISSGNIGDVARLPGGLLYGIDAHSQLVLIDPVALTTSVVGTSGNSIFGLAFRPDGTLFGVSLGSGLYTISPSTGAATLVANLTGYPGIVGYFDIKFDSSGHTYLLSGNNLYTVNTSTGHTTLVGAIGFSVFALDFEDGILYGFTINGKILTINTTTGAGTVAATETQTSPIIAASAGGVSLGRPFLTIQPANNASFALSWVAPSNYFRLQHNQDLLTTNWTTVANLVTITNSLNQVTVTPSIPIDFFRLIHP